LSATSARGSLAISPQEQADLFRAFDARDFAALRERGLRVGGRKFVFVREAEAGTAFHAVRSGELVVVRASGKELIVATSRSGMAQGRAVEAVYQYAQRTAGIA
jgi:hypothetical protein